MLQTSGHSSVDAGSAGAMCEPLLAGAKQAGPVARAKRYVGRWSGRSWSDFLTAALPCTAWLSTYDVRAWLMADVLAGLSVACMEIPQGLSYATLAGLPSVYGLYGAAVPCILYCLFGSSRQLSVGPVSVTSMLLGAGLGELFDGRVNDNPNDPADPQLQAEYNAAAVQVAFLVGCIYAVVGLLRLGWVVNFLGFSVISGFMSGASIVIALSQARYLLGLHLPRTHNVPQALHLLLTNMHKASWREFAMGSSFIAVLVAMKLVANRSKKLAFLRALGPLTVSVLSIAIMSRFRLYELPSPKHPYIAQVGAIPQGLPHFTAGWWLPLRAPSSQLLLAALIFLLDALEGLSMAKSLAQRNGYELDANQDLRALGIANLAGAAFNCYNSTGSFSRSAVNNDVGAKTPLASGVCGVLLMLTLLLVTPLFTHLSKNVQGAIIIVGVLGLIDWQEGAFLYKVNRRDFAVWATALAATMLLGVVYGILVAMGLAMALVIYKSAFPRIVVLGRLPDTSPGLYRNIRMYPITFEEPGMLLLRIDAAIYFANVQPIKESIRKAVRKAQQQQPLYWLILNLSPVTEIDVAAVHFLADLLKELQAGGLRLALANPNHQVLRLVGRADLLGSIGEENIFHNMHDAVMHAKQCMEAAQLGQAA